MNPMEGDPGAALSHKSLNAFLDMIDKALQNAAEREPHLGRALHGAHISSRSLFLAFVALILALSLPGIVLWTLRKTNHLEQNFRGDQIPQSFGIFILLFSSFLIFACFEIYAPEYRIYIPWLTAVSGFGLLGLFDDLYGDKKIKGLRGHMTAAIKEHRITSGFIKAAGGLMLAFWIGRMLNSQSLSASLLSMCVIALSANALNLLDLRPGRASGFFLVAALVLLCYESPFIGNGVPPLLIIIIPAAIVWCKDSRAEVMMGDAGSNILGAALGLAVCSPPFSALTRIAVLFGLILFHILTERRSLTQIIENNGLLKWVDRLSGVR